jgi:two-component system LytT family response regulator
LYHLAERRFPVIFQTAFDEFAIKAFEESACDYLLKPFSRDRFEKSFRRAEAEVLRAHADQRATPESASTIQEALPECAIYLERLCVDEKGVRIVVQVADVDSFVSRDHYTCVHVGHIEYLSPISLQQLEARLDPYAFARIHRNAMVRIASITALTRGGEPTVTLRNGQRLTVSRRSKTRLAEIVAGVSRP